MSTQNISWEAAITKVLEEAREPLHYKEIAHRILLQQQLRATTATPEATVAGNLSAMFKAGRVAKGAERGIYQIQTSLNAVVSLQDIQEQEEEAQLTSVAAYGLYWDRDKVNWPSGRGRRVQLLGSPDDSDIRIDFADQIGIYILYNRLEVMYVGRTTDSLMARLSAHNSAGRRSARWDQFSWFGFRKVNEDGKLASEMVTFSTSMLITILEAVMIEALIPPLNDKGGDLLGTIYRQVEDPEITRQREEDFRQMVARAMLGNR